MFTGIIEGVGKLAAVDMRGGDARLGIEAGSLPFSDVRLGESISVNGVCLTVVAFSAGHFEADASNETLSLTTLGGLAPGAAVNMERAMRPTDRLGGHLVSGHVDGVGKLLALDAVKGSTNTDWTLKVAVPSQLHRHIVEKGSVTIEGISLTVARFEDGIVTVAIIPHTYTATNLHTLKVGSEVNLEVDVMAKYAEQRARTAEAETITEQSLIAEGY